MQMDIAEVEIQQSHFDTMQQDGVMVFRNRIEQNQIEELKFEIDKIKKIVMSKIENMERPLKTYSDIAERHLGRLDYRCGFKANIFNVVEKPIIQIIKQMSPNIDFRYYWGAIPSLGGSGPTNMHRDVYPMLNTTKGFNLGSHDINLPPYYFTVLIPLVDITAENGPTEFIKQSHHRPIVDESKEVTYIPLLLPGDFLIFDGRTLHKGLANKTNEERLIAYITFIANWYHDQTFTIDNYLFPELV